MSLLKKLSTQKPLQSPPPVSSEDPSPALWEFSEEELMELDVKIDRKPTVEVKPMEKPVQAVETFEADPTGTIKKLFGLKPDTPFTFRVQRGRGDLYVNAMRQVISRTRRLAKAEKLPITKWKMLVVGIEKSQVADHVTIIRTLSSNLRQKSVYSDLLDLMKDDD